MCIYSICSDCQWMRERTWGFYTPLLRFAKQRKAWGAGTCLGTQAKPHTAQFSQQSVKVRLSVMTLCHRLNMEVDLHSFFWASCHVMCTAVLIGWDPAPPPSPIRHWDSYMRTLLVSQDRRHLFVTPCSGYLLLNIVFSNIEYVM